MDHPQVDLAVDVLRGGRADRGVMPAEIGVEQAGIEPPGESLRGVADVRDDRIDPMVELGDVPGGGRCGGLRGRRGTAP